jgi:hypothetical protein
LGDRSMELEPPVTTRRNHRAAFTQSRFSSFNFSIGHCALRPIRHVIRNRQAAACPRAAQKTLAYRSLRFHAVAALVPSAGIVNLQIDLRSERVP